MEMGDQVFNPMHGKSVVSLDLNEAVTTPRVRSQLTEDTPLYDHDFKSDARDIQTRNGVNPGLGQSLKATPWSKPTEQTLSAQEYDIIDSQLYNRYADVSSNQMKMPNTMPQNPLSLRTGVDKGGGVFSRNAVDIIPEPSSPVVDKPEVQRKDINKLNFVKAPREPISWSRPQGTSAQNSQVLADALAGPL